MKKTLLCIALLASLSACTFYDNKGDSDRLVTLEDQNYFLQVRQAILRNDRAWLAAQVALPLCCFPDQEHSPIRTQTDFIRHYDEIINPYVRETMRRQDRRKLKKDWAGIVVGNNVMWIVPFSNPGGGPVKKYQVYAIRSTPPAGWAPPVAKPEVKRTPFFSFLKKKSAESPTPPPAPAHQEMKPGTLTTPPSEKKKSGIIDWLLERD